MKKFLMGLLLIIVGLIIIIYGSLILFPDLK